VVTSGTFTVTVESVSIVIMSYPVTLVRLWATFLVLCTATCVSQDAASHFATRHGSTIRLSPIGASFRIPEDWLEWNRQFHNNLHLSRRELEKVKEATGEWDTEYSKVVNASLPFDHCSVHVGGEGWGAKGVSFGDLQMRAYVSDQSEMELEKRISEHGFTAAKAVRKDSDAEAKIAADKVGEWDRIIITYCLWYGDYGGSGQVEFYISSFNGHTAVLVFMHARGAEQDKTVRQILGSFSWQ